MPISRLGTNLAETRHPSPALRDRKTIAASIYGGKSTLAVAVASSFCSELVRNATAVPLCSDLWRFTRSMKIDFGADPSSETRTIPQVQPREPVSEVLRANREFAWIIALDAVSIKQHMVRVHS